MTKPDELAGDLTIHYHADITPDNDAKVDDLLGKMKIAVGPDAQVNPLDDSPDFVSLLQYKAADDEVDPALKSDLVLQDLASSGQSLMDRAQVEAAQTNAMEDEDALKEEAASLGEAAAMSQKDGAELDAVSQTLIDHPSLEAPSAAGRADAKDVVKMDENNGPKLGDVASADQENAVELASSFANEEDENEEAVIRKEEEKEKKMENDARKMMLNDVHDMKQLDKAVNGDVMNANRPN